MSGPDALQGHEIAEPPNNTQLFTGFLMLGLIGFGGVLPLARSMLVEQRRWLTAEQFTELLGLCQFLPGGNVINLSVAVGMEFRGLRGALCALLGLICAPTANVVPAIFMDYLQWATVSRRLSLIPSLNLTLPSI